MLYFVNTKTCLGEAIEVVNPADEEHSDMWHTYLLNDELCIYISVGLSFIDYSLRLFCFFSTPGFPHDTGEVWGPWGCSGLASGCRLDVMWTDPPISQQLFFEDLDMEAPLQGEDVGGEA